MNTLIEQNLVGAIIERMLSNKWEKKNFLYTDNSLTYGKLRENIGRITSFIKNHDFKQGDKVILSTNNDEVFINLFFSFLANGITTVILDPEVKESKIHLFSSLVEPKAIFIDSSAKEKWSNEKNTLTVFVDVKPASGVLGKLLGRKHPEKSEAATFEKIISENPPDYSFPIIDPSTSAYILFTSGTTSDPKGVEISYKNLYTHLGTLAKQCKYDAESRLLNVLLFSHADGVIQGPLSAFYSLASCYRPLLFDIQHIAELLGAVYKFRITHFIAVPTILSFINSFGDDLRDSFETEDCRFVISTGGYLEEQVWKEFERKFNKKILNIYGLTESVTGGIFTSFNEETFYGTIGRPVDCQAKIIDEKGNQVAVGQKGQLLMKGDHIMKGYFKSPEQTANVIRDGWLYTGDLASVDEKGMYKIIGRIKSCVVSGGVNIYPEEITEIINLIPEVMEATCLGIADKNFGEKLIGCVVLKQGRRLSESDIISFCRNHLEHQKLPREIYFFDELPKGAAGKVKSDLLREMLASKLNTTVHAKEKILKDDIFLLAAKCFKIPVDLISYDSDPDNTQGWDSLSHLELIACVEEFYNLEFSTDEVMKINRIGDLLRITESKLTT